MAECFWDHDAMIGVTEDCTGGEDPGGSVLTTITLWSTSWGGGYDAHEAHLETGAYPTLAPPADAGSVAVTGYFAVDPEDYIPGDVYAASVSPGDDAPEGDVELTDTLPAPVGVTETAFTWDAGNDRWVLTVPAAFIEALTSFGSAGLFVVVVDDVEHLAWLHFGAIG